MKFKFSDPPEWAKYPTQLHLDGLRRIFKATRYSLQGLRAAWAHEPSFRQEVLAIAVLIPLSMWLAESVTQWLLLIFSCLLVVITELLNSAIEAAADRFGPEKNELVGRAKDLGSAAVFVSLMFLFLVWGLTVIDQFIYEFWPT